jgi:CheY-like chemotaxis protein
VRPLEGYKILVIDDEPDVRLYLSKIFKDQGCEVIEAPDANQGMRIIRSQKVNLVTLDLILPHMTGEKLYWELRKDERTATLPVVIVSGYAAVDSPRIDFFGFLEQKGLPQPNGFLEKPVDPEKLVATVQTVLLERTSA